MAQTQGLDTGPREYRLLRRIFGAAAHLAAFLLTVFMFFVATPGINIFSWHPFLMPLMYFFMTEAILNLSPDYSVLLSFSRKTRVRAHWVLQVLCVLCALLGLIAIYANKNLQNKHHLSTWHGLVGFLTMLWVLVQNAGGVILLYPKLLRDWKMGKRRLYHATSGLLGYLLICTSLFLGMHSLWFTAMVQGLTWYLCALCPVLTGLVIMNQISNAYLNQKRRHS